jgi:hypothetical protein
MRCTQQNSFDPINFRENKVSWYYIEMEQDSIELLKEFEEEIEIKEPEPEPEPQRNIVDWKKKYDELRLKYEELEVVIKKSFEMIRYMGDTVTRMGFTFDEINGILISN